MDSDTQSTLTSVESQSKRVKFEVPKLNVVKNARHDYASLQKELFNLAMIFWNHVMVENEEVFVVPVEYGLTLTYCGVTDGDTIHIPPQPLLARLVELNDNCHEFTIRIFSQKQWEEYDGEKEEMFADLKIYIKDADVAMGKISSWCFHFYHGDSVFEIQREPGGAKDTPFPPNRVLERVWRKRPDKLDGFDDTFKVRPDFEDENVDFYSLRLKILDE